MLQSTQSAIDKQNEQIELEQESLAMGQAAFLKALEKNQERGTESENGPVQQLIRLSMQTLVDGIKLKIGATVGKRGKPHPALVYLRDVDPNILAYHTIREVMDGISRSRKVVDLAMAIGIAIEQELNYSLWKAQDARSYKITQKHLQQATTGERKAAITRRMFKLGEIEGRHEWGDSLKVNAGMYLLDVMLGCTELFEMVTVPATPGSVRQSTVLVARQAVLDWLSNAHANQMLFTTVRMPMVVPCKDWTGVVGGGYLTDMGGRVKLVKTRARGYLKSLNDVEMPMVYAAINAVQSVPWSVNSRVLDVAKECRANDIAVKGFPSKQLFPIPAPPVAPEELPALRERDRPTYTKWAREAAAVHAKNAKLPAKLSEVGQKMEIASKFANQERFYFPHAMDFRGRLYPVPVYLHPQGDDLARGLLQFADAKPITERGIYWLKVHLANCFGVDKVSNADRVAWVDARLDQLMDSAMFPLDGQGLWMKADDPWQALAACFELTGALVEGPGYLSKLSIPMDGTCNGLQNFSALLRDEVGGAATNLIPGDKPSDIYTQVANKVAERVDADAHAGNVLALLWVGKLSRKLLKQPVMTLPYGATRSGMVSQIENAAKDLGLDTAIPKESSWAAYSYLAGVTYETIGTVVIAAVGAMDWLRKVAGLVASEKYPVRWTSPSGFPVSQDYRVSANKEIDIHVNGARHSISIGKDSDKLDKRRQITGISPNLIHSYDAAHLHRTVVLAKANGIDHMSLIHDSYGTHACNTDLLHVVLREAFVQQYSCNLLGEFRDELSMQVPPELVEKMPELPPMGKLDIEAVRGSTYFFG